MTPFSKEYGEALFTLAVEENLSEKIHEDVMTLAQAFREEPKIIELLQTRNIPREERQKVLDDIAGAWAHPYVINFIKILCKRHAMHMFDEIASFIHKRYDEECGTLEALVTSAAVLTRDNTEGIRRMLEEKLHRKIRLIEEVDPELIGGVRVDVNGMRIDNTVAGKLENMRNHLKASV